jgi:hypothetical protein
VLLLLTVENILLPTYHIDAVNATLGPPNPLRKSAILFEREKKEIREKWRENQVTSLLMSPPQCCDLMPFTGYRYHIFLLGSPMELWV